MGLKPLAAAAIVFALSLAGCSGDDDGEPTSSSSSSSGTSTSRPSSSSSSSASTTSTGSQPANQAPSGSISVTVNGTSAAFTLTGSDPDGDELSWELDFGDGEATDGTSLPANVTHEYASAGNFTANFTITDGTEPVAYDVVVSTGTGAPQQSYSFSGTITGSWNPGTGYTGEPVDHAFEVTQAGLTMTAHLVAGPTAIDLDYELVDPSGETAASAAAIFPVDSTDPEPDLVVVNAATGSWIVRIQAGNSIEGEYDVTITFA